MLYDTIRDLVDDVVQFQEDTDLSLVGVSTERQKRLAHYYDRAAEEVWNERKWWEFKHATTQLTLANGQAALPDNFGGIGTEGYVVPGPSGSGQLPWVDVNYQELIAMRNNNVWPARYQQNRVYAIGPPVPVTFSADADVSGPTGDTYTLQASDPTGFEEMHLFVGAEITIAGFIQAANNGVFSIDAEITADEQYTVTKIDETPVGTVENSIPITISLTLVNRLSILSGNPADDRTIVVYHDVQLRRTIVGDGDLDKPIPFPAYCHNAIYTYVTWLANRSKNDKRDERFHADYKKALSQAIISGRPKQTRPQQLPMSVGRMW